MDGVDIEFAPGLNCIIGGRGTGKTTILELIRFVLDAMPEDAAARRRIDSLVGRNLAFGRVELTIETKDGLRYIISRAAGENPIVMTEDRKPTEITLKAGSFFKADVFSQNEVESIADRSTSQLDLIDKFEAERIAELNTKLRHAAVELTANTSGILPLQEKIAALDEELATLPGLEEKLKGMASAGGSDADAINDAHKSKALRDREKRATDGTAQLLASYRDAVGELIGHMDRGATSLFGNDMMTGPNGEIFGELRKSMANCATDVDVLLEKAQGRIDAEQAKLEAVASRLGAAHAEQEMAFRSLIEKHKAAMGQATERSTLEKRRNELLAKKSEREDIAARLARLQTDRAAFLRKLSDLRDERYLIRKTVADRINDAVRTAGTTGNGAVQGIRVAVTQDGNPEAYAQLLEAALRGARVKQGAVAEKIANALWPADLVAIVRAADARALVDKAELNPDQAEKVIAALSACKNLHDLEAVELIDQPKIELNDGGNYKSSESLSTGQKCTTILPILLMESEKPLLVDQPEDNLDNRFISQTVESVRKVKQHRQLIFVTHNPTSPSWEMRPGSSCSIPTAAPAG